MTAADFRRIALSLEGVEEYSHAGSPAFRVGGRKFASLASQAEGYGNLMLTPEQQAVFVEEAPQIFLPIPGGWGRMGHTHIRLAAEGSAHRCAPDRLETADRSEREDTCQKTPFAGTRGTSKQPTSEPIARGTQSAGVVRRGRTSVEVFASEVITSLPTWSLNRFTAS
jgi:hypothetical protein